MTTGMVEVIVRNALDEQMSRWAAGRSARSGVIAGSWLDLAPLDAFSRADVAKARERATARGAKPEVHGSVVAELTFGFWRFLVASRYYTSLWVPALHDAFPHGDPDRRQRQKDVGWTMQRLNFVRTGQRILNRSTLASFATTWLQHSSWLVDLSRLPSVGSADVVTASRHGWPAAVGDEYHPIHSDTPTVAEASETDPLDAPRAGDGLAARPRTYRVGTGQAGPTWV